MARAYDRKDRGARKKRPRRKAAPAAPPTKRKRRKVPPPAKKSAAKRKVTPPAKKTAAKRKVAPAKKSAKRKVAPAKKSAAKHKVAPAKKSAPKPRPPSRAELVALLAEEKVRARRLLREAQAAAIAAAEAKLKRRVDRANARLRRRIKELESLRAEAKRSPEDGALRRVVVTEQKAIAAQATAETLAIKQLPSATPRQEAASKAENASERLRRFFEVFRLAKKTGQLPKHTKLGARVDSWHQSGVRKTFAVDEILDEALVTDIMHRAGRVSRSLEEKHDFSMWQGYAMISGSGDDLYGSGLSTLDTSLLSKTDVDASTFQTRGYVESGYWNTRPGMLEHLERAIEKLLSAKNSLVYVHDVTIMYVTRKQKSR